MLNPLTIGRLLLHRGVDAIFDAVDKPFTKLGSLLGQMSGDKFRPEEGKATPPEPAPIVRKPNSVEARPSLPPKKAAARAAEAELKRTPESSVKVAAAPVITQIAPPAEPDKVVYSTATPADK